MSEIERRALVVKYWAEKREMEAKEPCSVNRLPVPGVVEAETESLHCQCGKRYNVGSTSGKLFLKQQTEVTTYSTAPTWTITKGETEFTQEDPMTEIIGADPENWKMEKREDTKIWRHTLKGFEFLSLHCKCGRWYNFSSFRGQLYF